MEGIFYETLEVGIGVTFTAFAILGVLVAGIFLAGMAEAERAGARLTWAEWPLPGTVETAREEPVRLAA